MENHNKITNPICAITWHEAQYLYTSEIPEKNPFPQITIGFIISSNDEFTNIAVNVSHIPETKQIIPLDGFLIPKKATQNFEKIENFEKNDQ